MLEKNIVSPGIVVYKNAFPESLDLINRYEFALRNEDSRFTWQDAQVGYGDLENEHRNCKDFKYKAEHLSDKDEDSADLVAMHKEITKIIRECLNDYCAMYGVVVEYQEAINVVKYGPNEFFNVHSDDGEPYRCTISTVGYLNDNYDGGELWFNFFDVKIKPEAGDLVVSPSAFIYSHASLPVTSGTKYALVTMFDRTEFAHIKDSPVYSYFGNKE
jgi:predicted 2-oxoglutarate/Fe(II)-dependent dioxygenase YbiX